MTITVFANNKCMQITINRRTLLEQRPFALYNSKSFSRPNSLLVNRNNRPIGFHIEISLCEK